MEFGNVSEVFELGDLVKINNVRNIHCGRTGTELVKGVEKVL